ncbi:hypothetical protein BHS04_18565 [Myxococcus xanthus]|nr:hypothetical protein BHS04_18565 [Myxococcus xanthus]
MDAPVIAFRGAAEFEAWLQTHADAPSCVWRPSGLAEVETAKADGRWAAAYASQKNATVPYPSGQRRAERR